MYICVQRERMATKRGKPGFLTRNLLFGSDLKLLSTSGRVSSTPLEDSGGWPNTLDTLDTLKKTLWAEGHLGRSFDSIIAPEVHLQ